MLGMAGRSHAQDYPVARQQIFIDDKGGAGGAVGTRQFVKSHPTATRLGKRGERHRSAA
jgi:tripartite-type tricarboxylate transporter receptor subunit TctC